MSRWPTLVGKLLTIHSLLRDIEVPWDHSDSNVLVVDWHAAPVVREDAQKVIMKHHIIPACEIQSLGQSHPCWDLGILGVPIFSAWPECQGNTDAQQRSALQTLA